MKIIEKKCLNCGKKIKFTEDDESCKCGYCGKTFNIDIDESIQNYEDQFILKMPTFNIFGMLYIMIFWVPLLLIISMVISFILPSINSLYNNQNINDISKEEFSSFSFRGGMEVFSYITSNIKIPLNNFPQKEKAYLAYNKDENHLIIVYKVNYDNSKYSLYVPVIFDNVFSNSETHGDWKISAPKYYLNSEKTSYIYGYASMDKAYDGTIKEFEKDYTITDK